jgi:hypothetical protein
MMKTREDFQPDDTPPRSIEDIVLGAISYTTYNGRIDNRDNPLATQSLDNLMKEVFARIERQALEVYHSNEI